MARRIARISRKLGNLRISHKPSLALLQRCACAITVSSTAAMEAMALGVSTRIVTDLGVNETLGNHYFLDSGALSDFDAIVRDPFTPSHDEGWLHSHGFCPEGAERFVVALAARLQSAPVPAGSGRQGPPGWGSDRWQAYALARGGRRMLSSAGARSRQGASHRGRDLLRRIRERLVGLWGVERLLKGR
jgi:hypothetical protein